MADIKQKYKTPSGDNIVDKDFSEFKEADYTSFKNTTTSSINTVNTNINNAIAEINKIKQYLLVDEVPVGTIVFHSSENQSGLDTSIWKECNGATLNKSDYPDLWTVIGSKSEYGNNGGSTFKLPDLVNGNRFIRVGSSGIGTQQDQSIKSHSHSATAYKGGNDVYGNWGMSNWQLGQETKLWTDSNGGDETRPINTRMRAYIKCKKRGGI